jgi:hypothetical protein
MAAAARSPAKRCTAAITVVTTPSTVTAAITRASAAIRRARPSPDRRTTSKIDRARCRDRAARDELERGASHLVPGQQVRVRRRAERIADLIDPDEGTPGRGQGNLRNGWHRRIRPGGAPTQALAPMIATRTARTTGLTTIHLDDAPRSCRHAQRLRRLNDRCRPSHRRRQSMLRAEPRAGSP